MLNSLLFQLFSFIVDTMNNTTGGVRLGDDVIGVIEEMFLRLRFVLHGMEHLAFSKIHCACIKTLESNSFSLPCFNRL